MNLRRKEFKRMEKYKNFNSDDEHENYSNNLFDDIDIDTEKENMLSQLRNFRDEDELDVDEDSSYEEIKEIFDEMQEENEIGYDALFPNGRDFDSEDEDW